MSAMSLEELEAMQRQNEHDAARRIRVEEATLHRLITAPYTMRRIGEVGASDEGLMWLERMAGEERLGIVDPLDRLYIEAYVTDPKVAAEIQRIRDQRDTRDLSRNAGT